MGCIAYYANPPHIPSKETKMNTSQMLVASTSSPFDPSPGPKMPLADSNVNNNRIQNWMVDGTGRNRRGRGGMPSDIDDRERKTFDWYTSWK